MSCIFSHRMPVLSLVIALNKMLEEKQKNKIRSLPLERKVALLYALLRSREQSREEFSELDWAKAQFFLQCLMQEKPQLYQFAQGYVLVDLEPRQRQTLLALLEREQGLGLREEEFLSNNSLLQKGDKSVGSNSKIPLCFVLHNIRSAFNVGNMFRLADAVGAERIYLCGYTAGPENTKVQKAAMGSEAWTESQYFESESSLLAELAQKSYTSYALDTFSQAPSIFDCKPQGRLALWVGNEQFGLPEELLQKIPQRVRIPMYGQKNSLNVANALAATALLWGEGLRTPEL